MTSDRIREVSRGHSTKKYRYLFLGRPESGLIGTGILVLFVYGRK